MSIVKDCYILYLCFTLIAVLYFRCYQLKNEISKQKEYFIQTLSHDLRVPLIAQIRGLDLVKNMNIISQEGNSLIDEINKSCKYTLDMISMMLRIYRIEIGDIKLKNEELNVTDVINEVFNINREYAAERNINISFNTGISLISADKENLTKILSILIHTVIEHSKTNTEINVDLRQLKNKLCLTLDYIGKSLTPEEYNRMFSQNSNYSTVGHGIQMYFCKKIIDLHKGKIEFTNNKQCYKYNKEYQCNSFTITLPCEIKKLYANNSSENLKYVNCIA